MTQSLPQEGPKVKLIETIDGKAVEKEFSSIRALRLALHRAAISNEVKYPLLKHGETKFKNQEGKEVSIKIVEKENDERSIIETI